MPDRSSPRSRWRGKSAWWPAVCCRREERPRCCDAGLAGLAGGLGVIAALAFCKRKARGQLSPVMPQFDQDRSTGTFCAINRAFPTRPVPRGDGSVTALPMAAPMALPPGGRGTGGSPGRCETLSADAVRDRSGRGRHRAGRSGDQTGAAEPGETLARGVGRHRCPGHGDSGGGHGARQSIHIGRTRRTVVVVDAADRGFEAAAIKAADIAMQRAISAAATGP